MNRRRIATLLVGSDDRVTKLGLLGAVGAFVLGLSLWVLLWAVDRFGATVPIALPWLIGALAVVSVVPPTVYAYHNEGLFVCLALGSAVPIALYLVPTASPTMAPDESVLWGIRAGLTFGLPAGTIGFGAGVTVRYLLERSRPRSRLDSR